MKKRKEINSTLWFPVESNRIDVQNSVIKCKVACSELWIQVNYNANLIL